MENIESRNQIILLFSVYRNLLSPKQQLYLEDYLEKDNTFTEIAERYNVSRQAVFDNVNKAISNLHLFELKVGVYERYRQISKILEGKIDSKTLSKINEIMLESRGDV